jgi:hypothetical protein
MLATLDEPRNRGTRPGPDSTCRSTANPYMAIAVVLFVTSIYLSTDLKNRLDGPDVILNTPEAFKAPKSKSMRVISVPQITSGDSSTWKTTMYGAWKQLRS